MFNLEEEKKILQNFVIPDISDIIISFINTSINKFDDKFLNNCVKNKDYLFYNKNNETVLHYILGRETDEILLNLFKNIKYIKISHFQNYNKYNNTELYIICDYKLYDIIIYLINRLNLNIIHFQNHNQDKDTELSLLCQSKKVKIIKVLLSNKNYRVNIKYFQNIGEHDRTELWWICFNNLYSIIQLIPNLNINHFQNKNLDGTTELDCYLFEHGMINVCKYVPDVTVNNFNTIIEKSLFEEAKKYIN